MRHSWHGRRGSLGAPTRLELLADELGLEPGSAAGVAARGDRAAGTKPHRDHTTSAFSGAYGVGNQHG